MMTPKQERNGVPGPSATRNTAVAGPDARADIAATMATATAAGASGPPTTVSQSIVDWSTGIAGDA